MGRLPNPHSPGEELSGIRNTCSDPAGTPAKPWGLREELDFLADHIYVHPRDDADIGPVHPPDTDLPQALSLSSCRGWPALQPNHPPCSSHMACPRPDPMKQLAAHMNEMQDQVHDILDVSLSKGAQSKVKGFSRCCMHNWHWETPSPPPKHRHASREVGPPCQARVHSGLGIPSWEVCFPPLLSQCLWPLWSHAGQLRHQWSTQLSSHCCQQRWRTL